MERNIEGYTNYHITNDGRVYSFNQRINGRRYIYIEVEL